MNDCVVPVHDPDSRATGRICEHCQALGRRAAVDLVEAWLCLNHALSKDSGASASDSPVTSAITESSPPLKIHCLDLSRKIEVLLIDIERHLRYRVRTNEALLRVRQASKTIIERWDRFLEDPDAPQLITDMIVVRDRAWHMLRFTELVHHLPLPCPICDQRDLRRPNGETWQRCHSCGVFISERDYNLAVHLALQEVRCSSADAPRPSFKTSASPACNASR